MTNLLLPPRGAGCPWAPRPGSATVPAARHRWDPVRRVVGSESCPAGGGQGPAAPPGRGQASPPQPFCGAGGTPAGHRPPLSQPRSRASDRGEAQELPVAFIFFFCPSLGGSAECAGGGCSPRSGRVKGVLRRPPRCFAPEWTPKLPESLKS